MHDTENQKKSEMLQSERKESWRRRGRETLESLELPNTLKGVIRDSLDTPQYSPYHHEGLMMDAHLGLMIENIEKIRDGSFDYTQLRLSDDHTARVRALGERIVREHASAMTEYTYLHDIRKPDCMNAEMTGADRKKTQRIFTMDEWKQIRDRYFPDEQKIRAALEEQGITKIGYRHSEELTGGEAKDHGPEAERYFQELAVHDPESAAFFESRALTIKGIANHEMHFQVFNAVKSGKQFEAKLASKFSPEEIEFILTVNLLDIASSLNEAGAAEYQGFRNMIEARDAYLMIQAFTDARAAEEKPLKESDRGMLMNLQGVDLVAAKIEQLKNPPRTNLEPQERELIVGQLGTWMHDLGIPEERKQEIEGALSADNYQRALGQLGLGKLAGAIRQTLAKR